MVAASRKCGVVFAAVIGLGACGGSSGGGTGGGCTGGGSAVCDGACVNLESDNRHCGGCGEACAAGEACSNGACLVTCAGGLAQCGAACVDTQTDPQNCGGCGEACADSELCVSGSCAGVCAGGKLCGGVCVNLKSDNQNCGDCGVVCPVGQVCSNSACDVSCSPGYATCGSGAGAYCADTTSDPDDCGQCGNVCAAGRPCVAGGCVTAGCPVGQTTCGSGTATSCTNLQNDPKNCGACGFVCAPGAVCSGALCGGTCSGATPVACNGTCVDTDTDPKNCGGCGHACGASEVCSNGVCGSTCASGYTTCGVGPAAYCAAVQADPQNCGACGVACPVGKLCAGGHCSPACSGILSTLCNGLCVDINTAKAHCGGCGNACAPGQVCSAGSCAASCVAGYTSCGSGAGARCADTMVDPASCGACDHACSPLEACSFGVCGPTCNGLKGTACNGTCVDVSTDVSNCGGCGLSCAPGQVCSSGTCGLTCDSKYFACGTSCADIQFDPQHCGSCFNVCPASQVCSKGTCGATCSSGTLCGTGNAKFCTDILSDPSNCGGCGLACPVPMYGRATTCLYGACGFACNPGYAVCGDGCCLLTSVTAGASHACAVTQHGDAMCWGDNSHGQLGDGTTTDRSRPVRVLGLGGKVGKLSAGGVHTCAVLTDGSLQCWGGNSYGELGDGTTTGRLQPVYVSGFSASGGAADVSAGYSYTCAITTAGGLHCWGYNGWGQLGDGTTNTHHTPVGVVGLSTGVTAVGTSVWYDGNPVFTCALQSGAPMCWGGNGYGQLGDGTTTSRLTPGGVLGLSSGVTAIAVARVATCALTNVGAVHCWGYNGNGELGDGSTLTRPTFGPVFGMSSGVTQVKGGYGSFCALTKVGALLCWGFNAYGQLGDGTTDSATKPVPVAGLTSGVSGFSVGWAFGCAETASGPLGCWGYNSDGQIGDGSTTQRNTPVMIQ